MRRWASDEQWAWWQGLLATLVVAGVVLAFDYGVYLLVFGRPAAVFR